MCRGFRLIFLSFTLYFACSSIFSSTNQFLFVSSSVRFFFSSSAVSRTLLIKAYFFLLISVCRDLLFVCIRVESLVGRIPQKEYFNLFLPKTGLWV